VYPNRYDADGNGTIEPAELMAAVVALEIPADADRPDAATTESGTGS
jgi:hypothetical protein